MPACHNACHCARYSIGRARLDLNHSNAGLLDLIGTVPDVCFLGSLMASGLLERAPRECLAGAGQGPSLYQCMSILYLWFLGLQIHGIVCDTLPVGVLQGVGACMSVTECVGSLLGHVGTTIFGRPSS